MRRSPWMITFARVIAAAIGMAVLFSGCSDDKKPTDPVDGNRLVAINGVRYRGLMGSSTFDRQPQFALTDANGNYIPSQTIQVNPVEGDGSLPRSITAESNGIATLPFRFDGSLPYQQVQLYVADIDTIEVEFRADAILPGPDGQVSYVRFKDRLSDVVAWMGQPRSWDTYPNDPDVRAVYASYENSFGLVVAFYDLDKDNEFYDTSSVFGVIANTIYQGKTVPPNSVGVGSSLTEARARFGIPDSIFVGVQFPDTMRFVFNYWGFSTFAHVAGGDTSLTEMHFSEYVVRPDEIVALDGLYSRGIWRGPLVIDSFAVEDANNVLLGSVVIDTHLVVGDGGFQTIDNMRTDPSTKIARYGYQFNGTLGHAVIRLTLPEVDTLDVSLRANVIIPGSQGQYALFNETWGDIRNWNGPTATISGDGMFGSQYVYARYSDQIGVTFAFHDTDDNNQIYDTSSIFGIITDRNYPGRTREGGAQGVRIGSTWAQMVTAYGSPTDTTAIAADTIRADYSSQPVRFDLAVGATDTTVARIMTWEAR